MSTHTHPNDGTKLQLNFLITKYFSHQFHMKNPRSFIAASLQVHTLLHALASNHADAAFTLQPLKFGIDVRILHLNRSFFDFFNIFSPEIILY